MTLDLSKIGIFYNEGIEGARELGEKIQKLTASVTILPAGKIEDLKNDISLGIVIGGDGTILKCARFCAPKNIPIFGFNMGRLGFLAQGMPNECEYVIEKIKNEDYRIEERIMLESKMGTSEYTALNDMVIKGAMYSRTSTLSLYINDELVSDYLADGLIISTPTGSTAYTLSAGGPVVSPYLECFIVVPICPHALSSRPLVVPSFENIKIKTNSENKFKLTADGQQEIEVLGDVEIRKCKNNAKLILLNKSNDNFYNVLRQKLHWGQKPEKC